MKSRVFVGSIVLAGLAAACNRGEPTARLPLPVDAPAPITQPAAAAPSTAAITAPAAVTADAPVKESSLAERILPMYAHRVTGGWRFPSRYHEAEWRRMAALPARGAVTAPAGLSVAQNAPVLVIIIDDLGDNSAAARRLAALPYIVNGAVLPHTPFAAQASRQLRDRGGDVILHLPLEPVGYPKDDPGPGALWVTMPADKRATALRADWEAVPGRIGLNNHMGSRFTADAAAMQGLAGELVAYAPLFIDSLTVPHSSAARAMARQGIPALSRTHFLDDVVTYDHVSKSFDAALAYARRYGVAVAIGHPNRHTLQVLESAAPRLSAAGVRAVPLREIFVSLPSGDPLGR